jgi:putative endonuclease
VKQYYVYILASRSRNLYVGVTNDLERRVYEHKQKLVPGFTTKYNIDRLVYFEATEDVHAAISREKQIKGWLRSKKIADRVNQSNLGRLESQLDIRKSGICSRRQTSRHGKARSDKSRVSIRKQKQILRGVYPEGIEGLRMTHGRALPQHQQRMWLDHG